MVDKRLERLNVLQKERGKLLNDIKFLNEWLIKLKRELLKVNGEIELINSEIDIWDE